MRYDISTAVSSLDPQYAAGEDAQLILRQLFEGLFSLDAEEGAKPAAVERYAVSEDGLIWTFTLREGLVWSDGEALTAADYAFALRRLFNPDYPSPFAVDFSCIRGAEQVLTGQLPVSALGIRAPDARTLELTLAYPVEELPLLLCSTAAMPCRQAFFEETRGRYGLEEDMLLYNGPFYLRYWEPGEYVQVRWNESYRAADTVNPNRITFSIQPPSEHFSRFWSGKTDAAMVSYEEWRRLRSDRYTVTTFEDTVWVLLFNQEDAFFSESLARRAFTQAIDRRAYASGLGNDRMDTTVFLPPTLLLGESSYRALAGFDGPGGDAGQAAEAFSQLTGQGKEVPSLTLLCADEDSCAMVAGVLQRSWRDALALTVSVQRTPVESLQAQVEKGAYQMAILPLRPDSAKPEGMLRRFSSSSSRNLARYRSEEYDLLLGAAERAVGEGARLNALKAAEEQLYEDAVLAPLYFQTHYYVSGRDTGGIVFSPFAGGIDFRAALKF
ncbi:MAG: peptide ABC transporter substrate-binding protein [Provencibacterium sp.]|nr:peptide ABC transporter substrate-binding protein [Provencibacterium sp.]